MIAYASATPQDAAPYLGHLARFCESGNLVAGWEKHGGGNHPDGWGIAYREEEEIRGVRSGKPAASDPLLRQLRVRTDRFIGHVRFASNPETVHAGNSHPFIASGIALAHNGTFHGKIGGDADARKVSDTLVFLELLAERWTERTLPELADALREMLSDGSLVGEYSAANLLVAAGDRLFAFRRYRKDPEYYTLYLAETEGCRIVSSQPLDAGREWRLLGDGELIDLASGETRSVLLP
ncbi:MAG: class II glutamine amidotransferase [Deltaproteobacteria bacterium]|nr:class II glutamine amidotransferase [Deltaproteobacteria bacterium]